MLVLGCMIGIDRALNIRMGFFGILHIRTTRRVQLTNILKSNQALGGPEVRPCRFGLQADHNGFWPSCEFRCLGVLGFMAFWGLGVEKESLICLI